MLPGGCLANHPPLQAFHLWCDRLAKIGTMKYGVADIIHAATSDQDQQRDIYAPMLGAVRQLIQACQDHGDIRDEIDPEDFLVLGGLLWRIPPDPAGKARVKRILALIFRGMAARGREPGAEANAVRKRRDRGRAPHAGDANLERDRSRGSEPA